MARSAMKKKSATFYATMHVTRIEHWCVDAENEAEARDLLAAGEGHRMDVGERLQVEIHRVEK